MEMFELSQLCKTLSQENLFTLSIEINTTQEFRDRLNEANGNENLNYGQKIVDDFMKMEESPPTPEPPTISVDEDTMDSMRTNTSGQRPMSRLLREFDTLVARSERADAEEHLENGSNPRPRSPSFRSVSFRNPHLRVPPASPSYSPTSPTYSPVSPDYVPVTSPVHGPFSHEDQEVAEYNRVDAIFNSMLNTPPPPTADENEDIEVIDVTTTDENTEEQS